MTTKLPEPIQDALKPFAPPLIPFLVFDIETAANDMAELFWYQKTYEAPSNYKDPEKIAAYIKEKVEASKRTSALTPWTGRVTCIVANDGITTTEFFSENEREVLSKFGKFITDLNLPLIGKSSRTFDIPFLVGRYIALDLGVPNILKPTQTPKDIDECFGYSSQCIRGSLDDYAWLMNVPGKLGHGKDADKLFLAATRSPEAWKDLVSYCRRDVEITAEFLRRYQKKFSF